MVTRNGRCTGLTIIMAVVLLSHGWRVAEAGDRVTTYERRTSRTEYVPYNYPQAGVHVTYRNPQAYGRIEYQPAAAYARYADRPKLAEVRYRDYQVPDDATYNGAEPDDVIYDSTDQAPAYTTKHVVYEVAPVRHVRSIRYVRPSWYRFGPRSWHQNVGMHYARPPRLWLSSCNRRPWSHGIGIGAHHVRPHRGYHIGRAGFRRHRPHGFGISIGRGRHGHYGGFSFHLGSR